MVGLGTMDVINATKRGISKQMKQHEPWKDSELVDQLVKNSSIYDMVEVMLAEVDKQREKAEYYKKLVEGV